MQPKNCLHVALIGATLFSFACGERGDPLESTLTGQWYLGKAAGGVAELQSKQGKRIASTDIDSEGRFTLPLELDGPDVLRVCVLPQNSARYVVPISKAPSRLDQPLCQYVSTIPGRDESVAIGPFSALAAALTDFHHSQGLDWQEALEKGERDVEVWFNCASTRVGGEELVRAVPQREPSRSLSTAALADIVTGALSDVWHTAHAHTPNPRTNATSFAAFIGHIADDLRDNGVVDGRNLASYLTPSTGPAFPGDALGYDLAYGIHRYLNSEHNRSELAAVDLKPSIECLGNSPRIVTSNAEIPFWKAPALTFEDLNGGAEIAPRGSWRIQAQGQTPIADYSVEAFHGPDRLPLTVESSIDVTNQRATIDVTYDFQALEADTPVFIVVKVEDALGYVTEKEIQVALNVVAPILDVALDMDGLATADALSGTVRFNVLASDAFSIESLRVLLPNGERLERQGNVRSLSLDTRNLPEGPQDLTFVATDTYGRETRRIVRVVVDNIPNGRLRIHASLGTPVEDATVRVLSHADQAVLSEGTTDRDGFAELQLHDLPQNYDGYVRVEVTGGQYNDLMTGRVVMLPEAEDTALFSVAPYALSESQPTISANLVTTCGYRLAQSSRANFAPGETPQRRIEVVHRLLAEHLNPATNPDGPMDARSIVTSDMLDDWSWDSEASKRLGLIHAGLAWDAAKHSLDATGHLSRYTFLNHFINLCVKDASNGTFDGYAGDGLTPPEVIRTVSNQDTLSADTFRFDTALGAMKWLDGEMPDGREFDMNRTAMRSTAFSNRGDDERRSHDGFFHALSTTDNALFYGPGRAFEFVAPRISVTGYENIMDDETLRLSFTAEADDESAGLARLSIRSGERTLWERRIATPLHEVSERVEAALSCTEDVEVIIEAVDRDGERAQMPVLVACHREPVRMAFEPTGYIHGRYVHPEFSDNGNRLTYRRDDPVHESPLHSRDGSVPRITKYWDRLHDQRPDGVQWEDYMDQNNIPVLQFTAEVMPQQPGEIPPAPSVTYSYLYQSSRTGLIRLARDKVSLLPVPGSNRFRLPLTYESLSKDLMKSHPDDVHTVRFIATDSAGRSASLEYKFHLNLLSAPVVVDNCQLSDALDFYNLAGNQFPPPPNPNIEAGSCSIRYLPSSAATTQPLQISLGTPTISFTPRKLIMSHGREIRFHDGGGACFDNDTWSAFVVSDYNAGPRAVDLCDDARAADVLWMGVNDSPASGRRVSPDTQIGEGYDLFEARTLAGSELRGGDTMPTREFGTYELESNDRAASIAMYLNHFDARYGDYRWFPTFGCSDDNIMHYQMGPRYWLNVSNSAQTVSYGGEVLLDEMEVAIDVPDVTASHPELPHVEIPVVFDRSASRLRTVWTEGPNAETPHGGEAFCRRR